MALDAVPDELQDGVDGLLTACLDDAAIKRMKALQALVIDELSMVDSDMLKLINENDALRLARGSQDRWGGVRISSLVATCSSCPPCVRTSPRCGACPHRP